MIVVITLAVSLSLAQNVVSTDITSRNKKLTSTISGYSATPVKKVSGTNESFTVSVNVSEVANTSGKMKWIKGYISSIKVELGGETVYDQPFIDENLTSKTINAKWDTTHFAHGTDQQIKVTAKMTVWRGICAYPTNIWTILEGPSEIAAPDTTVSVSIYNYASFCELPEFTGVMNGAYGPNITDKFFMFNAPSTSPEKLKVNYESSATKQNILDQLAICTLFWIDAHGMHDPFVAISANPYGNDPLGWWIVESEIQAYRFLAMANGIPTINFAMLDCCYVGLYDSFCFNFLYPIFLGSDVIDRCVTGWKIDVVRELLYEFTPKFYEELLAKKTVSKARTAAWTYQQDELVNDDGTSKYPLITNYLCSWGDLHTRITGLYDGTHNDASSSWFKVTE